MQINKIDSSSSLYGANRTRTTSKTNSDKFTLPEKTVESEKKVDSFEKTCPVGQQYDYQYPYGYYQLAQSIYATTCNRVQDSRQDNDYVEEKQEPFTVLNVAESNASHNDETNHYNSQGGTGCDSNEKDDSDSGEPFPDVSNTTEP